MSNALDWSVITVMSMHPLPYENFIVDILDRGTHLIMRIYADNWDTFNPAQQGIITQWLSETLGAINEIVPIVLERV